MILLKTKANDLSNKDLQKQYEETTNRSRG